MEMIELFENTLAFKPLLNSIHNQFKIRCEWLIYNFEKAKKKKNIFIWYNRRHIIESNAADSFDVNYTNEFGKFVQRKMWKHPIGVFLCVFHLFAEIQNFLHENKFKSSPKRKKKITTNALILQRICCLMTFCSK